MYTNQPYGPLSLSTLSDKGSGAFVSFTPQFGGAIQQITLQHPKTGALVELLDTEKSGDLVLENRWYKGAHLIPFPNRIRNGEYTFNDTCYQLEKNFLSQGHAIHGLVYDKELQCTDETANSVALNTTLRAVDHAGYPFTLAIELRYTIEKSMFHCAVRISNQGDVRLPVGIGWHPYFTTHGEVGTAHLQLPNVERIQVDECMIPTGSFTEYSRFATLEPIADTTLDDGFKIIGDATEAHTLLCVPAKNYQLDIVQNLGTNGCRYLQVFTPPSRSSIAIEPMTCAADAFNNKMGLLLLDPRETYSTSYGVRIRKFS